MKQGDFKYIVVLKSIRSSGDELLIVSVFSVVPTTIGMVVGQRVRKSFSEIKFQKIFVTIQRIYKIVLDIRHLFQKTP